MEAGEVRANQNRHSVRARIARDRKIGGDTRVHWSTVRRRRWAGTGSGSPRGSGEEAGIAGAPGQLGGGETRRACRHIGSTAGKHRWAGTGGGSARGSGGKRGNQKRCSARLRAARELGSEVGVRGHRVKGKVTTMDGYGAQECAWRLGSGWECKRNAVRCGCIGMLWKHMSDGIT
jgi:hypothetical protein